MEFHRQDSTANVIDRSNVCNTCVNTPAEQFVPSSKFTNCRCCSCGAYATEEQAANTQKRSCSVEVQDLQVILLHPCYIAPGSAKSSGSAAMERGLSRKTNAAENKRKLEATRRTGQKMMRGEAKNDGGTAPATPDSSSDVLDMNITNMAGAAIRISLQLGSALVDSSQECLLVLPALP